MLLLILTLVSPDMAFPNLQGPTMPFPTQMLLHLQVSTPGATSLKADAIPRERSLSESLLPSESLSEHLTGDRPVLCHVLSLKLEFAMGNYNIFSSWPTLQPPTLHKYISAGQLIAPSCLSSFTGVCLSASLHSPAQGALDLGPWAGKFFVLGALLCTGVYLFGNTPDL